MDDETMEPREQTIDEVIARYYGKWILLKITDFDEYSEPERGIVVAHSPHHADPLEAFRKEPARSELLPDTPPQPYYFFKAFPRTHAGETYEEAAARFAKQRAAVTEPHPA